MKTDKKPAKAKVSNPYYDKEERARQSQPDKGAAQKLTVSPSTVKPFHTLKRILTYQKKSK